MSFEIKKLVEALVESELSIIPPQNYTIYFDMDGVLADFESGVDVDAKAAAARDTYRKILDKFPEFKTLPDDDLKKRLAGPQSDPGLKALKKAWNDYRQLKYIVAGKPGFFLNLAPLPGAKEMLIAAAEMTGQRPSILTAPMDSLGERCEQEKGAWMQKNFPGLFAEFHCTQEKANFAGPGKILIDDRTKYTVPFEQKGGIAILHKSADSSIEQLRRVLSTGQK